MCIAKQTWMTWRDTKQYKFSGWIFLCILLLPGSVFGETIAFSGLTENHWQIWEINPATRKMIPLTSGPPDKKEFAFFHKKRVLLCRTANAECLRFDLTNGQKEFFLQKYGEIFDPAISPNDQFLIFSRFRPDMKDDSDIWLYDFVGRQAEKLTEKTGLQYDPAWSPDGRKLAYVSSESGTHDIYLLNMENRECIRLTNDSAYDLHPSWSPDGKHIVYASNSVGDYEIWRMNEDGTGRLRLTKSKGLDTQPVWMPGGKQIVFVSNRRGNMGIWIMNVKGGEQRPLTPNDMVCSDPNLVLK